MNDILKLNIKIDLFLIRIKNNLIIKWLIFNNN